MEIGMKSKRRAKPPCVPWSIETALLRACGGSQAGFKTAVIPRRKRKKRMF